MSKVNDLLTSRFKKASKKFSKMTDLAEKSSTGKLSSFSGVFRVTPLTENEEDHLRNILSEYSKDDFDVASDLQFLSAITSEVKAINNQAAILHGERIKKAKEILRNYYEGAFSAWLVATYGNRQTPYNFLQYYELYSSIPKMLQDKVDLMPRQAIYTLATRNCPAEQKEEIIKNYKGESKQELLSLIREQFPLTEKDKRTPNTSEAVINQLLQAEKNMGSSRFHPTKSQKKRISDIIRSIQGRL